MANIIKISDSTSTTSSTQAASSTAVKVAYDLANASISGLSVSGKVITYTKNDGTTGTITTQDNNTDTKVTQTLTTTNAEYALLAMADASATANKTNTARFSSAVTLNPSTQRITTKGLNSPALGTTYVSTAQVGGAVLDTSVAAGVYMGYMRYPSSNGAFTLAGYKGDIGFYYLTKENIDAGTNTVLHSLKFNESGLLTSSGGFKGALTGNASTATKLATARTIDGVSFNGSAAIVHFGTCSTEAATVGKVVALTGFSLVTGSIVFVKFTVTNTAASPTLNVNNTGAKAIMYRGAAISAGYLAAKRIYMFVYDGTNWELVGDLDTNTKYTAMSASEAKTGTATTARSITAKVLNDKITERLNVVAVSAVSDLSSKGNGWYSISSATLGGVAGAWTIQKMGTLYTATNTSDPRVVLNSVNLSNWYSPYAYWHA